MTAAVPKLLPVSVPWMISPSVPALRIASGSNGKPIAVTFIGFFKCDESALTSQSGVTVVDESVPFEPSSMSIRGPFRMVKVAINEGRYSRVKPAYSDVEVIPRESFDWSEVKGAKQVGESAVEFVARIRDAWQLTQVCPNPRMYELLPSPWISELGLSDNEGWHHYLLAGHDEYIEVIAKGWSWQPGQLIS